jgi:hypothetical protein
VFTTVGGQSKCPGETMTSARESMVFIRKIQPRCGTLHDSDCSSSNLLRDDDTAYFGVVISNLSPTSEQYFHICTHMFIFLRMSLLYIFSIQRIPSGIP